MTLSSSGDKAAKARSGIRIICPGCAEGGGFDVYAISNTDTGLVCGACKTFCVLQQGDIYLDRDGVRHHLALRDVEAPA